MITQALKGREDQAVLDDVAARVGEPAIQFSPYPRDFAGHV